MSPGRAGQRVGPVAAAVAPVVAPLLVDTAIEPGELIVRFSLVVLVPLVVGLAVRARSRNPRLEALGDRAATLVLAAARLRRARRPSATSPTSAAQ